MNGKSFFLGGPWDPGRLGKCGVGGLGSRGAGVLVGWRAGGLGVGKLNGDFPTGLSLGSFLHIIKVGSNELSFDFMGQLERVNASGVAGFSPPRSV